MKDYIIITDSCCDLPLNLIDEKHLVVLPLGFTIDNKNYKNYPDGREMSHKDFYTLLREQKTASTSQLSPNDFIEALEPLLKQNLDVLCINFSSALSGTYNSLVVAKSELEAKYTNSKIIAIDSLSASLGQGLLVHTAVELKKQGKSIDEVASFVEENKLKLCHLFTVDDLGHLKRGGRVSSTKAFLGTMLQLKPVLHVDNQGRLVPLNNVRGRKGSFKDILDKIEQRITNHDQVVFISHGDCQEDAEFMATLIKEKFSVKDVMLSPIGPVIGAHAGPNTIAVFFYGKER